MVVSFPPVEMANEAGLLAIGGDLEVPTLELAYRSGIFPWPVKGQPLLWFAPPERAVLEFTELRVGRRLQRYMRGSAFEFRVNTSFEAVIKACASSKRGRGQRGTWITPEMIQAYIDLHKHGKAESFEIFVQDELVAGLYGVRLGHYFAGESMFHKVAHTSKFVLVQTVKHLSKSGFTWMDVQLQSPLLESFGVKEIPRDLFMQWLKRALV